jgi:protein-S-isoprenylcysteine O-methyltransferase Ste14
MLVTFFGIVLVAPTVYSIFAFVIAAVAIAAQVRLEERHLLGQHGEAYAVYVARVGRFVPWLGRIK